MMCWWTLMTIDTWLAKSFMNNVAAFSVLKSVKPIQHGAHIHQHLKKSTFYYLHTKMHSKDTEKKKMDHANLVFGNKNVGIKWPHAL